MPDPENFPIAQEFLKRRAQGESRGSILADFRARKIMSPSGKSYWSSSTCNSIENNLLTYCGHLVYNRHNRRIDGEYIGGNKFRPADEWEIRHDSHEAAITSEEAEAIEAQLKERKARRPKARRYLLTGLLNCGVCNGPMVGDSGFYTCSHKRNHSAECTNSKISSEYIDKKSIAFVKEKLLTRTHFEDVIAEVKMAYEQELRKTRKDTLRYQKRHNEINNQINRLMSLFERWNISPEIIEERITTLNEEKQEILDILNGSSDVQTMIEYAESELDDKMIRRYVDRFEDLLDDSNLDLMRDFLKTFVSRIELYGRHNGKKRGRKVYFHGKIPHITGIELASPGGRCVYPHRF